MVEESRIYGLVGGRLLEGWRDEIERGHVCVSIFLEQMHALESLEKILPKDGIALLKAYSLALENKLNYINHNLNIKLLNYGIKIGMELQTAFSDFNSEN